MVFTDLVDSTALRSRLGESQAEALDQQHRATVRETLRAGSEGQEVSTAGDGFLLAFNQPSEAVRFALDVQARMRSVSAEAGTSLLMRIGIHWGEVTVDIAPESDRIVDLTGLQVDLASRVMGLALGGQILMTRGIFDNARAELRGRDPGGLNPLRWCSHGPYILKGFDEPIAICEVGEEGVAPFSPPQGGEKAQRFGAEEEVDGWRPAVDVRLPNTNWVLEEKLGAGGFGEVWLAHDVLLPARRTVFKFCTRRNKVASLRRELAAFNRLAERSGRTPPGIVEVRSAHDTEPPYYIELEHISGGDLRGWINSTGRDVPFRIRLDVAYQMVRAVAAVHDAGLVHRDIKPSNFLVEVSDEIGMAPQLHLTDFGLGQDVLDEQLTQAQATQAGVHTATLSEAAGTFMYIAPELLRSTSSPGHLAKRAAPSSDMYSLGVTLYQLFAGDSDAVPGPALRALADPILRADIAGCLDEVPQSRPSAANLLDGLGRHAERLARFQTAERSAFVRRRRKDRALISIMALSTALAMALGVFSWHETRKYKREQADHLETRSELRGIYREQLAQQPENRSLLAELIDLYIADAQAQESLGNRVEAQDMLREALDLLSPLLARYHDDPHLDQIRQSVETELEPLIDGNSGGLLPTP